MPVLLLVSGLVGAADVADDGHRRFRDAASVTMSSGAFVLLVLVAAVTVHGFLGGALGRSQSRSSLDEWALGGRRFGTFVSWFLLGGDFYTAYTFIAVPALVYGVGALGFFAVPYTTIAYPIAFVVLVRFWGDRAPARLCDRADFVRDRFGCRARDLRRAHRRGRRDAVYRAAARRHASRFRAARRRRSLAERIARRSRSRSSCWRRTRTPAACAHPR